jgi:hypothetical protein
MSDSELIPIVAISVSLTDVVGADDSLLMIRVTEDGREGNIVYARTLRPGEDPPTPPLMINPSAGEILQFRSGAISISLEDVDRSLAHAAPDGFASVTNTLWTWLMLGSPASPELFRYLLAASRRLDAAHAILVDTITRIDTLSGTFLSVRAKAFETLGIAEVLVVALGRTLDMVSSVPTRFGISVAPPSFLMTRVVKITKLRNAFEHIEDRALGQVRGKPHAEALTIFDQAAFLEGKLSYAGEDLELREEGLRLAVEMRHFLYAVAASIAGEVKQQMGPMEFFRS